MRKITTLKEIRDTMDTLVQAEMYKPKDARRSVKDLFEYAFPSFDNDLVWDKYFHITDWLKGRTRELEKSHFSEQTNKCLNTIEIFYNITKFNRLIQLCAHYLLVLNMLEIEHKDYDTMQRLNKKIVIEDNTLTDNLPDSSDFL